MAFESGTRLGPYEVVEQIGSGGMGEVWLARDTALNRDVAVKVLPQAFVEDADRLARFQREAEILASLNHANIATIYGLEKIDDQTVIVMELVEGPTLAEKIAEGPIPVDEAMGIALQIVAALEAAHDKQIVHRDLKPANVKVKDDGTVKVLDFGIAKALDLDAISGSPVMTTPAVTVSGVILGSAAYMSPEQARGKPVDQRTDIWAFGCLLYEMLTGQPAFGGEDVAVTLARVLERETNLHSMQKNVAPAIRHTIELCLKKDSRHRIADIRDVRLALDGALIPEPDAGESASARRGISSVTAAAAALAAALIVGGLFWALKPAPPAAAAPVTRSLIAISPFDAPGAASPDQATRPVFTAIALSPDETMLVLRRDSANGPQLFRRPLDSLEVTPIPGTEGVEQPFFSPDGGSIGFRADGALHRVPSAGGPRIKIVDIPGSRPDTLLGASWGDGNVIVFSTIEGLWRVQASGEGLERITEIDDAEGVAHRLPHVLPGGDSILYSVQKAFFRWTDSEIVVQSLETGERHVLVGNGAADARYVPSGHIVFMRRGALLAAAYDLERKTLTGEPVALFDNVMQQINAGSAYTESGAAQLTIGASGALVYATGGIAQDYNRVLVLVDRNGNPESLPLASAEFGAPRLAPDGRIVVDTSQNQAGDEGRVWIYDGRTLLPLTAANFRSEHPIWSSDYSSVIFSSTETGDVTLYRSLADRTGTPVQIASSAYTQVAGDRSLTNLLTFVEVNNPVTGYQIYVLDLSTDGVEPEPFKAGAMQPAISSDGRYIAYVSAETGTHQVFVEPYPGPGRALAISTDGGDSPAWREDGKELYYVVRTEESEVIELMAVDIVANEAGVIVPGVPHRLFSGRFQAYRTPVRSYDVTADGQQFLFVQPLEPEPEPATELVLVQNWFEELERLVPTD